MTARLALVVSLIALILAGIAIRHEGASVLRVERHATATPARPALSAGCVNASVPSGCIFGLSDIQYVVLSQYAYEASILPFGDPIGDYDYLLGYGVQQTVRLPGGAWNRFRFAGAVCVPGSGWVAQFIHLNHGHDGGDFDFLHLQYVTAAGRTGDCQPSPAVTPPVFKESDGESGDEHTAQVAAALFAQLPPSASGVILHGGQIVGRSMWPTSTVYGNGSCCQSDSHLCVLLSAKALGFFWNVATGRDRAPKPKPFPAAAWSAYTRAHHLKPVPYLLHGTLRPMARHWLRARWLGGVEHEQVWHAKLHEEVMPFRYGWLRYFPRERRYQTTLKRRGGT